MAPKTSVESLIRSLNRLLETLSFPNHLRVESPTDLTPSLLLAILESILRTRLPLPDGVRAADSFASKVDAMKILLGVLGDDVLTIDVGVGEVDPRRLAKGEWNEVVFVGQLLCWLGHEVTKADGGELDKSIRLPPQDTSLALRGVSRSPEHDDCPVDVVSPSMHSTATASANTIFSLSRSLHSHSPDTTVHAASQSQISFDEDEHSILRAPTPRARDPPACIHQLFEDDTIDDRSDASQSFCDCDETGDEGNSQLPPVRFDGWIERADEGSELRMFERLSSLRRSSSSRREGNSRMSTHNNTQPSKDLQQVSPSQISNSTNSRRDRDSAERTLPSQRTLVLMDKRAALLSELATSRRRPST